MGWVKERFEYDSSMASGIPKVWCALKSSLKTAEKEFQEHFNQRNTVISVTEATPNLMYILVREGSIEKTMQVSLDNKNRQITITRCDPQSSAKLGFLLNSDGEVSPSMDGKLLMIEQASRLLLEPLLFPA